MSEERPYAFISYSHRDSDRVVPVLDYLKQRGVAVWYDQGIEVGSEWPEFIAQALVGAQCVIAFITPNSVASQNCRREINFAISKGIDVVAAYLEPTDLSPGMELQLNTLQALFREYYPDDGAFADALVTARVLQPCIDAVGTGDEGAGAPTPSAGDGIPAGDVPESDGNRGVSVDDGSDPDTRQEAPVLKEDDPLSPCPSAAEEGRGLPPKDPSEGTVSEAAVAPADRKAVKPSKRLIGALLALVVIIGCCVGGVFAVDASKSKVYTDESGSVVDGKGNIYSRPLAIGDQDLVGGWQVVSVEDKGTAECGAYEDGTLGFTFEGTYFGSMFQPDDSSGTSYAIDPTGSVSADSDGRLVSDQMDASIGEGDFTWEYRISDFTDGMLDAVSAEKQRFLATGEKNLLTIHVTGTYRESATAVREVDSTIVLAKKCWNWSDGYLMQDTLPGVWTDSFGNTWTFSTSKNGVSTFALTTADGGEFEDGSVSCSVENDYSREYLVFSFEDPSATMGEQVIRGYIQSVGYSQIVLEQTDGAQLILTRSDQGESDS
ncbi:MAG: toll/interleukin-1 receptor domain-containing protein [Eggerthellaceae bacterium]